MDNVTSITEHPKFSSKLSVGWYESTLEKLTLMEKGGFESVTGPARKAIESIKARAGDDSVISFYITDNPLTLTLAHKCSNGEDIPIMEHVFGHRNNVEIFPKGKTDTPLDWRDGLSGEKRDLRADMPAVFCNALEIIDNYLNDLESYFVDDAEITAIGKDVEEVAISGLTKYFGHFVTIKYLNLLFLRVNLAGE